MRTLVMALVVFMGTAALSTLHAAELHGIVTGKDGKPVAMKVVLKDAEDKVVIKDVSSLKDGTYSFKDIKPGSYVVAVGDNNEWKWKIFVGPGETRRDFSLN